jgi:ABC-type thiamin/hydroxymethylpyrimidine transport system permease subunit
VTLAALNEAVYLPPFSLSLVTLALMDGMTLTFFFNVTDTGQSYRSLWLIAESGFCRLMARNRTENKFLLC